MVATNWSRRGAGRPGAAIGLLAWSVAVAGCGTGVAAQGSFERTYTVNGPIRLDLANASGSVRITGSTDNKVRVHGEIRARSFFFNDPDKSARELSANPPIEQRPDVIRIGKELSQFFDVSQLGAVVTKSIMTDPRSGRPTPRMVETPSGMLNSIGLQGPGIDSFLQTDLPWLKENGARAVVSIAGGHTDEYVALAKRLYHQPVDAIEVNLAGRRLDEAQDAAAERRLAAARFADDA